METKQTRWENFQGKATDFLKKQGLFVVLGLCALCVAIAAAVRFLPRGEAETPLDPAQEARQSEDDRLDEVLRLPTPTAEPSPAPTPGGTTDGAAGGIPTPAATRAPQKGAAPVEGAVIWGYAVDSLLYSVTLEQWTTHEGVDIAARMGTEVRALRAGTVARVYEDGALGVAVEISHEGGLITVYANLQEKPPVQDGQKVDAGAIIGLVGNTAASECALEAHLHFAVYKDGKPADPAAYALLGG